MTEELKKIIKGEVCPYCNCNTNLVSGEIIYPEKLNETPKPKYLDKMFYQCTNDRNHYVGTYHDNLTSLGRLADTELRRLKNKGHKTFDPLWKEHKIFKSQKEAYIWLSDKMELPIEVTHFGMFTNEQCMQAIHFCDEIQTKTSFDNYKKIYTMELFDFFTKLFRIGEPTPDKLAKRTIRKMGYKEDFDDTFVKDASNGTTMIWITNNGVKIKVYSGGYAESDFLPGPITDTKRLKQFIRDNEL